jgi:hypothetical protein
MTETTRRGRIEGGISGGRVDTHRTLYTCVTLSMTRWHLTTAPWMTLQAVKDRHRELVERDWRSLAEVVVAEQFPDGSVSPEAWQEADPQSPFLL